MTLGIIVKTHLSPLISALGVHEGHLDVVPPVGLVVAVPLQPSVHLGHKVSSSL